MRVYFFFFFNRIRGFFKGYGEEVRRYSCIVFCRVNFLGLVGIGSYEFRLWDFFWLWVGV